MFFLFIFFRSFFDQCYRDPLYPTRRVLNPPASPPHNSYPHIPPLKPRKSLPPRRMQVVTSASPLRHAQVCCHHPVTVRKTRRDTAPTPSQHGVQARLRRQPAPRKPRHGATPTRHASPAMACKPHHDPNLPRENLATSPHRSSPTTPTRCTRGPPRCHPPRHHTKASPVTFLAKRLPRLAISLGIRLMTTTS